MTEPWEEAMERVEKALRMAVDATDFFIPDDFANARASLATIRKHIEDQAQILKSLYDDRQQTIEDLTEASQVERAAALVTIEELTEERDGAEATERDAWKQVEEQERTIDYLERRIEELQRRIKRLQERLGEHQHELLGIRIGESPELAVGSDPRFGRYAPAVFSHSGEPDSHSTLENPSEPETG